MKRTKALLEETGQMFAKMPEARKAAKKWGTLRGIVLLAIGIGLLHFQIGGYWLGVVFVATGGVMFSGDYLRVAAGTAKAAALDSADAIRSIKNAILNGKDRQP